MEKRRRRRKIERQRVHETKQKQTQGCITIPYARSLRNNLTAQTHSTAIATKFYFLLPPGFLFCLAYLALVVLVKHQQIVHIWFGKVLKVFFLCSSCCKWCNSTGKKCSLWCCFFSQRGGVVGAGFLPGDSDSWCKLSATSKHFCLSR